MTARIPLVLLAEAFVFFLASINQRATAKYKIGWTLTTDGGIAAVNFTLIKWIGDSGSIEEQIAFVVGAILGSYIGMRLTKSWESK